MGADALVRPDETADRMDDVKLPGASGGHVSGIATRTLWFPIVALVAQQFFRLIDASHWWGNACHVAALCWVIAVSLRAAPALRVGGLLAAAGGTLNLVAIVHSGGVMPVSPAAVARLDNSGKIDVFRDHVLVTRGLGSVIGDVIVVPPSLIVSPGDILIFAGLVLAGVHLWSRRRRRIKRENMTGIKEGMG